MQLQTSYSEQKNERFRAVSEHIACTPFYRAKLAQAGIDLTALGGMEDLPTLPFTTKDELRAVSPAERSPYALNELEFIFSSSGTSGTPTLYYWTRKDTAVLREVGGRFMSRVGVGEGDLVLVVAPLGLPVMGYCMVEQYNAAGAGVIVLGVQPPDVVLQYLADYPVSVLITLPVAATRLAEYAAQYRPDLWPAINLRQVHCGGDFLSEGRRQCIEQAWGARCYNFLGMSEIFGPFAGEGPEQDGLRLAGDYVHIEVIDPQTKQPVAPGRPGIAVYTTLWPKGAPLLRYWSDDFVTLEEPHDEASEARLRYLGRARDLATGGATTVFAQDIENVLLAHRAIGNEWQMVLDRDGPALVRVEVTTNDRLVLSEIEQTLGALLTRPVTVEAHPPGSLPRLNPKPDRLVQPGI